jgi:D-beta-D-heptose 7-phosphate kinase / D-beta-D-heptose 1-phosphate adenosyltransferase
MKKVWLNGCFDVLHHAHFKMIEFASTFVPNGGLLVIGIDSDRRVKELKGNDRPFHSEEERKYNLEQIVGEQYAKSIVYFNRMEDFSTTKILTNA